MTSVSQLVVFAGSGSPHHPHYKGGYDLIEERAASYGYSKIELVSWPGQGADDQGIDSLTFRGAQQVAEDALIKHEERKIPYTLVARSFGTLVAASLLASTPTHYMDRVVFWGPPPFWEMWKLFSRDFDEMKQKMKKKGTLIATDFFASLEPFEANVAKLTGTVVIATGTEDEYCPPPYREYLKCLAAKAGAGRFDFREVVGGAHEVDYKASPQVQQDYIEELFRV